MAAALDAIARRWPDAHSDSPQDPVFVLAAGWRSGSTWVQRGLMTSGQIVIWGEPYCHGQIVQGLAQQVLAFDNEEWPFDEWIVSDPDPVKLADAWSANAYPALPRLLAAHRMFLTTLFEPGAPDPRVRRWGLKEVRLGMEHARYLKWVFPKARFVFLIRNPYRSYQSYRRWGSWYFRWPEHLVATPRQFGRMWATLTRGFLAEHRAVGGVLMMYEELKKDPHRWQELSEYLDLDLSRAADAKEINLTGRSARPIPSIELRLLEREVAEVAAGLGYRPER